MAQASIPTAPILLPLAIPTRLLSQGDMGIYVDDRTVLISSKSNPGQWRIVDLKRSTCSCESFAHRGTCRHLAEAREAQDLDRATARPAEKIEPERPTCPSCSKRPVAVICGKVAKTCARCALFGAEEEMTKAMAYDPERQARTGYALNN